MKIKTNTNMEKLLKTLLDNEVHFDFNSGTYCDNLIIDKRTIKDKSILDLLGTSGLFEESNDNGKTICYQGKLKFDVK